MAERIGAGVATPSEQNVLSHYTGWGSTPVLRYAFPQRSQYESVEFSPLSDEIKELGLSDDETRSMRASSLNAHYTSISIIKALWKVLIHIGVANLKTPRLLEPSAGIGHFFSAMSVEIADRSKRVAVELDKLTAEILRLLHPDTTVHN